MKPKPRGTAAMSLENRSEVSRKGGLAISERRGSAWMQELGRKGGASVSKDKAHMAAIGRIGGFNSALKIRNERKDK